MNYQVFARKWRPKTFADVAGQQDVITAITNSFNLNRIHHAYILFGTRGTGKTTIARLLAKGLNCAQGLMFNMCGHCENCKDIELNCFTDLIEIDAAYYTKVEDIRDFLDNVQYSPSRGRFKIYLIDEVHMLSKHSFNALLKILEEPPEYVKFILITTAYQKLPETIISRCLQFYLKPLGIHQIVAKLVHICNIEQIKVDEDSLKLLAYSAQGSMRDALNLLEQSILFSNNNITVDIINNMLGTLNIEQTLSLVESLVDGKINDLMQQIDKYAILGINWDSLFKEILTVFQKIAMNQFSSDFLKKQIDNNDLQQVSSRIYNLSNRINPENVQMYYQIFLLSRRELPYAPSYRMGMEMAILRALAFFPANIDDFGDQQNSLNNLLINNYKNSGLDKTTENAVHSVNIRNTDINTENIDNNIKPSLNYIQCSNNSNLQKTKYAVDHHLISMKIPSGCASSVKVDSSCTSQILDMRSKLIEYRKHVNKLKNDHTQSNTNMASKQISKSILDKFFSVNLDIKNKDFDNIKKK